MGKHRDRGSSLGKMLKDIDVNQIMTIMSALGGRNQNTNVNSADTKKKSEDLMQLLSNEKFMETVSQLSSKIKQSEDEDSRQESIKEAFDTIQSIVNNKK